METNSLFGWLVADCLCWFVLREEYCWLVADGWFVLREKYCWLVADKPSEQAATCNLRSSANIRRSGAPSSRADDSTHNFNTKLDVGFTLWSPNQYKSPCSSVLSGFPCSSYVQPSMLLVHRSLHYLQPLGSPSCGSVQVSPPNIGALGRGDRELIVQHDG
jgi:hypothetical protein